MFEDRENRLKKHREKQFLKLQELMENRGYSKMTNNRAIDRAGQIPHHVSQRRVLSRKADRGPVFALTYGYDPRLSAFRLNTGDLWSARTLTSVRYSNNHLIQHLGGRQRNIRDNLIRLEVPEDPKIHPERKQLGLKKSGKNYTACPHIREVKSIRVNECKINQSLNFDVSICVNLTECRKNNQENYQVSPCRPQRICEQP
jgi:hypothetical protein